MGNEKQTAITDMGIGSLEEYFRCLDFTRTPGYRHYTTDDSVSSHIRTEGVTKFLQDDTLEEPPTVPGRHSLSAVEKTAGRYQEILDILMSKPVDERSADEERLIDTIINKTGELFRYEEIMLALGEKSISDVTDRRRIAGDLSLEIMGGIDRQAFNDLVDELVQLANQSSLPEADYLKENLAEQPKSDVHNPAFELTDSTVEVIRGDILELFPKMRSVMQPISNSPVSPHDALEIFKDVMSAVGLPDDWSVELDDGKCARTDGVGKTIYIGKNRDPFSSYPSAVAVGFHESIHAMRSGGTKMPGSLDFEEGIATCFEQIITGVKRTPGKQYYLSIGLQAGADRGGKTRSYRETFEVMWRRNLLFMEKAGDAIDTAKARSDAQRQVQRTRRGGAIDTRDSAYFVGFKKASEWLNKITNLPASERREALMHVVSNAVDPTA